MKEPITSRTMSILAALLIVISQSTYASRDVSSYLLHGREIRVGDNMKDVRSLFQIGDHVGSEIENRSGNHSPTYYLRVDGTAVAITFSSNLLSGTVTKIVLDDPKVHEMEMRSLCTKEQLQGISNLVMYEGKIGEAIVRMTLTYSNDGKLIGRYFYTRHLKDINLIGAISENARDIELTETDNEGQPSAVFKGDFQGTDPSFASANLGCEIIKGTWTSIATHREIPFQLQWSYGTGGTLDDRYGTGSTAEFEQKVIRLIKAVEKGDRPTVADSMKYPLRASIDGREVTIRDRKAFLQNYSRIFTPQQRSAFRNLIPKAMFHRYDGVSLGGIWLDYDGKVMGL